MDVGLQDRHSPVNLVPLIAPVYLGAMISVNRMMVALLSLIMVSLGTSPLAQPTNRDEILAYLAKNGGIYALHRGVLARKTSRRSRYDRVSMDQSRCDSVRSIAALEAAFPSYSIDGDQQEIAYEGLRKMKCQVAQKAYYHSSGVIELFTMIEAQKFVKILIGLVLLGLVAVTATFAAAPEGVIVPVSPDNVQRLEITVDSYSFTPNRFVVKQNIPVELTFKSVSWVVPHNFVLKSSEAGLAIEKEIEPGETIVLRFTPTHTGEFKFSCTKKLLFFPSHADQGMVGTLVVER